MFTRWDSGSANINIWCWGATSWLWCPTSSLSSTQAATSPSTAGRMRSSERFERCLSIKPHNSNQVLHGLLGWQSRPAGGGGVRLRYGEKSFCHLDLTITFTNTITIITVMITITITIIIARLRNGEASHLHRDLTITTFAPWDPGASSIAPMMASAIREENLGIAETGFMTLSSHNNGVSSIPTANYPDQINESESIVFEERSKESRHCDVKMNWNDVGIL